MNLVTLVIYYAVFAYHGKCCHGLLHLGALAEVPLKNVKFWGWSSLIVSPLSCFFLSVPYVALEYYVLTGYEKQDMEGHCGPPWYWRLIECGLHITETLHQELAALRMPLRPGRH